MGGQLTETRNQEPETKFRLCGCCGDRFYPNELQRCGLARYCRYCLDSGLVAGVQHDTETAPDISDMTGSCWLCGKDGCPECAGD